jgi:hypothetical protein
MQNIRHYIIFNMIDEWWKYTTIQRYDTQGSMPWFRKSITGPSQHRLRFDPSQPSLCEICAGQSSGISGFSPSTMQSWFSKSQLFEALFLLSQRSVYKVISILGIEFSWSAHLCVHTCLSDILYCLSQGFFVYYSFLTLCHLITYIYVLLHR